MSDSEAMQIFLNSFVTQEMIHHLVSITLQILPCENAKTITVTETVPVSNAKNAPTKTITSTKPLPSLMTFITKLVRYTNVYTGTLMSTIVYMNRLKNSLPADAKGLPCTRHRIFLACLIIASKTLNDSSPKNKHWAKYTDGLFKREDVNLMERQLLMLLDWNVQIENNELKSVWKRFLDPIKTDLRKSSRIRNNLSKGMLTASTQTIVVPQEQVQFPMHTRNSSVSTIDSSSSSVYSSATSMHSRSSSVSSIESLSQNYNQTVPSKQQNYDIQSALKSLNSNTPLNNYLKSVAMKEEQELNDLIREYCCY